jgi:cysteine dioxygenase
MKPVQQFLAGLREIQEQDFGIANVSQYMKENPVDPDSLLPYLLFDHGHYTRNLIYRCDLFELMTICWDIGQSSRIHNHQDQNCWMSAPLGRLVVDNFDVHYLGGDSDRCKLTQRERIYMDREHPSTVDPARPVHRVSNPSEYAARAVSLHIYSRPFDRCMVYSQDSESCHEAPLAFDTIYGKAVRGDRPELG